MTASKSSICCLFERAASSYDAAAVLQREVSDRMFQRLDLIKFVPQTILDAGSGTGYGARALRQRYADSRLVELDLASTMLQVASGEASGWQKKLPFLRASRPWQVCGDIESLPLASNSVDMVWSNLTLQWLAPPDTAFTELARVLRPDGLLMFSTLGPDTLKELRQAFSGADGYAHVNRFIDMHDIGDALVHNGFCRAGDGYGRHHPDLRIGEGGDAGFESDWRAAGAGWSQPRPDGQKPLAEGAG